MLEERQTASQLASDLVVREFHRLASIWQADTIHLSDVNEKCAHPAYQQIVALGPGVVPLILHELEIEPDDWFAALHTHWNQSIPHEFSTQLRGDCAWLACVGKRPWVFNTE